LIGIIKAADGNIRACDYGLTTSTDPTAAANLAAATAAGVQQCV